MSRTHDELRAGGDSWYLRKADGAEYGPEDLSVIARWAAESRVVAGNAVSRDRKAWTPVESVPELQMDWLAELPDGRKYGPFNLQATRDLHGHKVLPANTTLQNRHTGETTTVGDYLKSLEAPAAVSAEADDDLTAPAEDAPSFTEADSESGAAQQPAEEAEAPAVAPAGDVTLEPTPSPADEARKPSQRVRTRSGRRRAVDQQQVELWSALDGSPRVTSEGGVAAGTPEAPVVSPAEAVAAEPAAPEAPVEAAQPVEARSEDSEAEAEGLSDAAEPSLPAALEPAAAPVASEPEGDAVDLAAAAAELDELRREVSRLREQSGTLATQLADAMRQVESAQSARSALERERQKARKEIEAAEARLAEALRQSEEQIAAEKDAARKTLALQSQREQDLARKTSEMEERLNSAVLELKKARNEEAKVTTALRDVESHHARKTAAQEARLRDLVQERNKLTEQSERQTVRIRGLQFLTLALLLGIALAGGVVLLNAFRGRGGDDVPQPPGPAAVQGRAPEAVAAKPPPAAGKPAAAVAPAAAKPSAGAPPAISGVPGVRVMYARTGCVMVFDSGAFSSGLNVSAATQTALKRLVPQIKPYLTSYDLVVEGHTDASPVRQDSRYGSNDELAMSRARAFAKLLQQAHGIPAASMRTVAGAVGSAPYPNTDEASRARNRTVVLKLVRHAGT